MFWAVYFSPPTVNSLYYGHQSWVSGRSLCRKRPCTSHGKSIIEIILAYERWYCTSLFIRNHPWRSWGVVETNDISCLHWHDSCCNWGILERKEERNISVGLFQWNARHCTHTNFKIPMHHSAKKAEPYASTVLSGFLATSPFHQRQASEHARLWLLSPQDPFIITSHSLHGKATEYLSKV